MVNFIIFKSFSTHFTVLKRTREFRGRRIELHKIFGAPKRRQSNVDFCFNQLIDGAVDELLGSEGQGLHWQNHKWLDEGEVVEGGQVSFDI
jgi:hypothetical protein